MKTTNRQAAALLLILSACVAVTTTVRAQELVIGTGAKAGVYYQLGRAICRLVKVHGAGMTCSPVSTDGSKSNVDQVSTGFLDLGVVQSDVQFHAANNSGPFEFTDLPHDNLRALFSAHNEPFTLVARRDAGIASLDDLTGRRVNIGNPGSGQRETMNAVMQAQGWTRRDFQLIEELPADQQSLALCHDRVQAMVYTVGHPNASVGKATGLCDATIVEVAGPSIDRLVDEHPYYSRAVIPGGVYDANPDDVRTFGVTATLVTSSDVAEDTIYKVVKIVFEHLDELRAMHPALGDLDRDRMLTDGLTAPLHQGAEKYYREAGLK